MTIEDKHSELLSVRVLSVTAMSPLTTESLRFSPTERLRTAQKREEIPQLIVAQALQEPFWHQTATRRTHGQHFRDWTDNLRFGGHPIDFQ